MKISDIESTRASQVNAVPRTAAVSPTAAPTAIPAHGEGPAAQIELSAHAQTIAAAKVAVDNAPETRDDLVAKLKSQIDGGTYKVSGADIAEQMLRRAKADRIS